MSAEPQTGLENEQLTEGKVQENDAQEEFQTEPTDEDMTKEGDHGDPNSSDEAKEEEEDSTIPKEAPEEEVLQDPLPEDEGSIPNDTEDEGTEEPTEDISEQDILEEEDFLGEDEPQTVLVLEEDITKRASNIKYFRNEDHSYTAAVYPDPVHYEEDGEWKEIDNRLKDGEAEEGTQFLENSKNLLKVKFAKKSNGSKLVKLNVDDFQISWDLKDALKVDAVAANNNTRSPVPAITQHKEEEISEGETGEKATIFTESPQAAQSGETDAVRAEEAYGNQLNGKAEYNTGMGILPEEQEVSEDTDDENEETLDDAYYREIEKANQEKMEADNLSSGVVYENIYPYVDIEYVLKSQELKENIILKSAEAQNQFVFQMKVNGLELVEENGQIYFKDGEGNTVFTIQKPFAYDASGEFTDKVTFNLVKGNGKKSELTVTVDREWLDAEKRQFPVVIDPVVQTDQDANSIIDTYALSGYPNNNYYARPILKTGVDATAGVGRSFIRFALPELKSGDMVVDATLNLYCYSTSISAATIGAYQVMDTTWTSTGVTWKTQPIHENHPEDYVTFTPKTGNLVSLSITKMAKCWYEEASNGGVMLRSLKEDGQYVEYVSADYSIESKTARPSVLITYISNNGLEDYWTYHEQDVGRAGTGYVNDYNGNLVFLHQTAATSGSRMPVYLAHVYNTNDKDINLGYGYGWRLNYHQTLKATQISGIDCYEYVDEDGTYHYFQYDKEDSKWKDESGIDLELAINSSSSDRYVITDKQDHKLIFDTAGKLIKVKDQNGNTLTVTYTGDKIASITDGVGRKVTCTYNSSGLLSGITSPSGNKSFTYSSSMLTKITDEDSRVIQYTYNSLREMTGAQNIDGYKIVYEYTPWTGVPHRIYTVTEYAGSTKGQSFQIARYGNRTRTRFTDDQGRIEEFAHILRWDGVLASIIMEHAGMIYFCSMVCYLIKLSYVISRQAV